MSMNKTEKSSAARPWWREGMMWLVVGGPGAVVLASFATLALALSHPDPVIESPQRAAADSIGRGGGEGRDASNALTPALKARNHAATGGR